MYRLAICADTVFPDLPYYVSQILEAGGRRYAAKRGAAVHLALPPSDIPPEDESAGHSFG